jgi:hypothetical protein
MTDEVRYWDRLGIYVSKEFAEEYIEKTKTGGGGMRGEYLDADIEEFQTPTTVSPNALRKEVEEIFSKPYEEVELPPQTKAMFVLLDKENNKSKIIKQYKKEGMSLEDAKARYTAEIETVVADALGLELGEDSTEDSSDGEE